VDRRHGGRGEGADQGAVDVVDRVDARHGPVAPGQRSGEVEVGFGGQGEHAVEDCDGADGLHYRPGVFAGEVEARVDGGFALGVEVCEPLGGCELFSKSQFSGSRSRALGVDVRWTARTNGKNCHA